MAVEIERKFISPTGDHYAGVASVPVRQGYLSRGDAEEARVRQEGETYALTVKKGRGLERLEFSIGLTEEQFTQLWPATEGARVAKLRYTVPLDGGLTASVDVFEGALAGLTTVEVEFTSSRRAAAFEPPAWFGMEVTGDPGYANARLASDGVPAGPAATGPSEQ